MRSAGGEIAVMQVIRFDPAFDQGAHQFAEHGGVIVDAAQQHALAQHRNAGVDHARAGCARVRREFTSVIGMEHHVGRLTWRLERAHHRGRHARRRHHRYPAVHADDLEMLDRTKRLHELSEPARVGAGRRK